MDMTTLTTKDLIGVHNERCPKSDRLSSWKASKAALIAKIEKLGERPKQTSKPKATEKAKRAPTATISASVRKLLADPSLSYDDIVQMVRAAHPDAATTTRSVASVASEMRRRGVAVAMRKGGN
jgi:hypothetical protein